MIYAVDHKMGATNIFMITLANTDQFILVANGSKEDPGTTNEQKINYA